jgi:hypothetical protein
MNTPRPRRTIITGARAQFANLVADVVNVSHSGALVRAPQQHAPGSQWPLVLDLDGTPLELNARVVRCQPVAGPLSTSTGKYTLALTFVNPSDEAIERLEHICKAAHRAEDDERRLQVSLERRCPKCKSRDVAKEARRSYSCCQCGRVFTGFRLGFLRFAR